MKKPILVLLALIILMMALSGCSSGGSDYTYSAPQIKSVSSGRTGVILSFTPVNGVESYRILRKNEAGRWTVYAHTSSTSFTDEDVKSASTYSYTVLCESEDGKTPLSAYDREGQTITYVAMPELSKISTVFSGLKVEWKSSDGAAKYRVLRKTDEEEDWEKLADVSSTSYTDTSVESGREYSYTIRCLNSKGRTVSSFDTDGLKAKYYSAPALSTGISVNGTVALSWRAVAGADQYRVYRKEEGGSWTALENTSERRFVDRNTEAGKKYTYTVRCLDIEGKALSAYDPEGLTIRL